MYVVGYFSILKKADIPVGDILCIPVIHSPSSLKGQGPAIFRIVSDLCLWIQLGKLQDCRFLASGDCCLVDEAGLDACACFLVGRAGHCPLVFGIVSLVGRDVSSV